MDSLRYTASARLGMWDSLAGKHDAFRASLEQILQNNSHAVLESNQIEFTPTSNLSLASVTAICDKIIARGSPTLVDLEFERKLINGPCQRHLYIEELTEGPAIGFRLSALKIPGTMDDLLNAAQSLLFLPYRKGAINACALPPELQDLTSEEEDLFFNQFKAVFGEYLSTKLHRQVLFRDLVNQVDANLEQSRVDFAFQVGSIRWVFEIDGPQHNEIKQRRLDEQRDALLRKHKWAVYRISTEDVRKGLEARFKAFREKNIHKLHIIDYESVQAAIAESEIHAAAFNSILIPLALQRCLRGLLLSYLHEALNPSIQQRILLVEEDLPVASEAFRILHTIWDNIHTLAPDTFPAPSLQLDIIGGEIIPGSNQATEVRHIDKPEGDYDIILSHSFFLDTGCLGDIERIYFPDSDRNLIRLRHAIGFKAERSLQWCEPLHYDLVGLEQSVISQNSDESESLPVQKKRGALLYFLRHIFRKRNFWEGQLQVIVRLLQGKATIVLLPTGGGKSLTYQFSGLLLPGMTVIIDPLISLMVDQVENLRAAGIDLVMSVSSQQGPEVREAVLRDMESGKLAFIFVGPERLQSQDFRNRLQTVVAQFPVSLAVIDEAHCVSEWGHDFRPSYLHMPRNLQRYCSNNSGCKPTLVGLTGTASFSVLTDVQLEMQIMDEDAVILPGSFERKELCFEVIKVPMSDKPGALKTTKARIPRILNSNPQNFYDLRGDRTNSGIVFCPHVGGSLGVVSVAGQLGHQNFFAGRKPKLFEGNQTEWNTYKSQIQKAFKKNHIQEIVATTAFGMGIDKPNIRYTIHYALPQSIEAFYQEAGRAGRNGIPQYALSSILYSDDNWDVAMDILNESDHRIACSNLEEINWNNRGDILFQLWLLFKTYSGRSDEKEFTLYYWNHLLAPVFENARAVDATNTQEIRYGKGKEREEKAIFRLMALGIVQDYTIDWRSGSFVVTVQRIKPSRLKDNLRNYLMQYKFQDFADDAVSNIPEDTIENALQAAVGVLIDFIYDEIVTKRKQALRTMGELCRSFTNDREFREAILAYLQESEFSDELRKWIGHGFDDIGLEAVNKLLEEVTTLEKAKRLVGTTRRLLDEDPQNLALRYLSLCARAQSGVESDSSVHQEATAFSVQVVQFQEDIQNPEEILLASLNNLSISNNRFLNDVGDIVFRCAGTVAFARLVLHSELAEIETFCTHSIKLLMAGVLHTLVDCAFYTTLQKEIDGV
ncbi:MAG: RecQ family ATP-dependent DNA helicase [Gammaproteobacteria bacterium]|nr:RecQ family ATP-dependent DNA helicase [Gammaproteobacteria bacterium]